MMSNAADKTPVRIKNNRFIHHRKDLWFICFILLISLLLHLFFLSEKNLLPEEAYYWNYANHLDIGYLDHPPMVAFLIKLSTTLFGINELSVRITTLVCWFFTALFSFKWSDRIAGQSGLYALLVVAILPFFFLQSLIITPDAPLILCWSAALYYLYGALVMEDTRSWYAAGIWIGLGLLSKYTIVLLGPVTLLYMVITPSARFWFFRREPYLCALIAGLLFTPVIYWNATHEWMSFVFQFNRRIEDINHFSFLSFIGLLALFLLPPGVVHLWQLLKSNLPDTKRHHENTLQFLRIYTFSPLLFFAFFSIRHEIKFNWIGPVILALIPWMALLIARHSKIRAIWFYGSTGMLLIYAILISMITIGSPTMVYQQLFRKFIAWDDLTQQLHAIAKQVESKAEARPVFVPLERYHISSELSFYQARLQADGRLNHAYPIISRHIFGEGSLMYSYWDGFPNLAGKNLILVSQDRDHFDNPNLTRQILVKSPLTMIWSHNPNHHTPLKPYYYQIVRMKQNTLQKSTP
ncbi:glycosyltransferase family 39 protein [Legionella spiritensis]|uniref:Dolichyl-phosphate mannosyltransferase n=1 Tax=Legionella spiritensis TaxID=452 RepID=A0A0W0YXG8_LEGSP|nr:glycosyltransferase family 39 protein [Legionella spiritensis]KTD61594.1 dolichyl-phosphate mannosyltransferase [Legionella spiritensis]SNV39519.1 dolichyl-phosphate mannosyltransferase [Legionella spiritensis]